MTSGLNVGNNPDHYNEYVSTMTKGKEDLLTTTHFDNEVSNTSLN